MLCAQGKSLYFSFPSCSPASPHSYSDRRLTLIPNVVQASIHANGATSEGWNASTPPSAAGADPTSRSPQPTPLDGSPQPLATEGQKGRRRASTLPSVPRRGMHMWEQQNRAHQPQHKEQGVVAAASPAWSANSGSLGVHHPLSEFEAPPMTPYNLVDRHSASESPSASSCILLQELRKHAACGAGPHQRSQQLWGRRCCIYEGHGIGCIWAGIAGYVPCRFENVIRRHLAPL